MRGSLGILSRQPGQISERPYLQNLDAEIKEDPQYQLPISTSTRVRIHPGILGATRRSWHSSSGLSLGSITPKLSSNFHLPPTDPHGQPEEEQVGTSELISWGPRARGGA